MKDKDYDIITLRQLDDEEWNLFEHSQQLLYELAAAIREKRFKEMYPEFKYKPSQPRKSEKSRADKI